jgi:hypothetical protein
MIEQTQYYSAFIPSDSARFEGAGISQLRPAVIGRAYARPALAGGPTEAPCP